MVEILGDHLWQSAAFSTAAWLLALCSRQYPAAMRLWLWRLAALKLVLPFSVFYALGEWIGFPIVLASDPAPPALANFMRQGVAILAPAQQGSIAGVGTAGYVLSGALATAAAARLILRELGAEQARVHEEAERELRDPDDRLIWPGFIMSASLTTVAIIVVVAPLMAGALANREWRHELLIANSIALRNAPVEMKSAAPGMGGRTRVIADARGVLIRNVSVQDLVALAYGVSHYEVWSDQMYSSESDPDEQFWFSIPRYDLRVTAPILEPEEFDPYALRRPVTQLLSKRFGVEIYKNNRCQPPCGKYNVALSDDPL